MSWLIVVLCFLGGCLLSLVKIKWSVIKNTWRPHRGARKALLQPARPGRPSAKPHTLVRTGVPTPYSPRGDTHTEVERPRPPQANSAYCVEGAAGVERSTQPVRHLPVIDKGELTRNLQRVHRRRASSAQCISLVNTQRLAQSVRLPVISAEEVRQTLRAVRKAEAPATASTLRANAKYPLRGTKRQSVYERNEARSTIEFVRSGNRTDQLVPLVSTPESKDIPRSAVSDPPAVRVSQPSIMELPDPLDEVGGAPLSAAEADCSEMGDNYWSHLVSPAPSSAHASLSEACLKTTPAGVPASTPELSASQPSITVQSDIEPTVMLDPAEWKLSATLGTDNAHFIAKPPAVNHIYPVDPIAYLPSLTLLRPTDDVTVVCSEDALLERGILIEEKLAEFKVKVSVVDAYAA